jgi:hypothetical protein
LNIAGAAAILRSMTQRPLFAASLALALLGAGVAQAACFADYKAKRDDPLQLHYGVIELPDAACTGTGAAGEEIRRRIAAGGWQLLNVVSIFGADGLEQRKESAGEYYLRF